MCSIWCSYLKYQKSLLINKELCLRVVSWDQIEEETDFQFVFLLRLNTWSCSEPWVHSLPSAPMTWASATGKTWQRRHDAGNRTDAPAPRSADPLTFSPACRWLHPTPALALKRSCGFERSCLGGVFPPAAPGLILGCTFGWLVFVLSPDDGGLWLMDGVQDISDRQLLIALKSRAAVGA